MTTDSNAKNPADLSWDTVAPTPGSPTGSTASLLRGAFSRSEALVRLVRSASEAEEPILLLVNDPHRSTPTRPTLTALAELLGLMPVGAGPSVRPPRFRVVVATGTHRFDGPSRTRFEQATFVDCGLKIEDVSWHDALASEELVAVADVRMHRWFSESRFLLAIGSVEPHYFAGVTGPHKTATVGCMSHRDIEQNHEGALDPASDLLRLEGNPVYDGMIDVLGKLQSAGKTLCTIGVVVSGEHVIDAAAGEATVVLDTLLPAVRRTYVREVAQPVDVLRLRVPPPLGLNLYQADKALKNNHRAVRDGGGIVLEAACVEGIGPDAFLDLLRAASNYRSALRSVQERGYRLGDHKAVKLRHLMDPMCRGVHVTLATPHLSSGDLEGTGIEVLADVETALERLHKAVTGSFSRGLIVEDAGMVCVALAAG